MGIFLLVAFIILVVIALLNSFVTVPPAHVGWLVRFNGRVPGGVLREQPWPHHKLPFVDKAMIYSLKLVPRPVDFTLTAGDKVHIIISGKFQYRLDPDVLDTERRPVFVQSSAATIQEGIIEAVEARLGGLGGRADHLLFITNRPALGDIINAILRLSFPPHLHHQKGAGDPDMNWVPPHPENPGHPGNRPPSFCTLGDACEFDEEMINVEDLVDFYNTHWRPIRALLRHERNLLSARSEVERRYGIDIEAFDIGNVDFTEETKKAFEEEKQAEARAKAGKSRVSLVEQYKQLGLSPKDAADQADIILDPRVTKTITSVQGDAGLLGGLVAGIIRK